MGKQQPGLSLIAARSQTLWERLCSEHLGTRLTRMACGVSLLDVGTAAPGSLEAGRLVTELAQGGLAEARLSMTQVCGVSLPAITVETFFPACACLEMQMATAADGAMLSGPLRLFLQPARYAKIDVALQKAKGAMVGVIQPWREITDGWAAALAKRAGIPAEELRLVSVPMESVAGSTQICGRMNENITLTVARSLGLDPLRLTHLFGACPVTPVLKTSVGGKTLLPDDFLHYLAEAVLTWEGEEEPKALAESLCFRSAPAYGTLFADLMEAAGGDFYKIPNLAHINKLARVTVNELTSGALGFAGKPEPERLRPYLSAEADREKGTRR